MTSQKKVLNDLQKLTDETEYLLQSEANKNRLLQAIKNVENRQHLIEVNLDEIEKQISK
ncbi:hypothetical protein H6G11_12865 [Cyanobacterium aponinum FACHB-4101]|nr:hypothetical protein [Cyanobacterium aponinum]MBD2395140.1 hypothetical protein [Cyanobacterium aponinum FACHB-4101]